MRNFIIFILFLSFANSQPTDMCGNPLTPNVSSIASIWNANNQMILLLGGADKLVATTDIIKANANFAKIYPRIKKLPALLILGNTNAEEVLRINPHIVITSNKNRANELRKFSINAVCGGFSSYADLEKSVDMMAYIIGENAPQRAQSYKNFIREISQSIGEKTKNLSQKPRILHITNAKNLTKADGAKTIIDEWISLSGGENVIKTKGAMQEISKEELIALNPQIVIIGGKNAKFGVAEFASNPQFSEIDAVKNSKVFPTPSGIFEWDRTGAETPLQIIWAAKIFHPEIFANTDLQDITTKFYKEFFDFDLSDENYQRIFSGEDFK